MDLVKLRGVVLGSRRSAFQRRDVSRHPLSATRVTSHERNEAPENHRLTTSQLINFHVMASVCSIERREGAYRSGSHDDYFLTVFHDEL